MITANNRTEPLSTRTWFRTGGRCQYFFEPQSPEELQENLKKIKNDQLPWFILGAGSNSLVMDEDWPGAVLSMAGFRALEQRGSSILFGAGVLNRDLVHMAWQAGLAGAAWMQGLPGQTGATIRMNARCYGGEISQIIRRVRAMDVSGQIHEFSLPDPAIFSGYKNTIFMQKQLIVFEAEASLRPGSREQIKHIMDQCEDDRRSKHQFDLPSCGCVFKNNYAPEISVPSGLLLDLAGARNLPPLRGAKVSPWHGNFIFNDGASACDILRLSLMMREKVWAAFGVWLEYEMEILGKIPASLDQAVRETRAHALKVKELTDARAVFQQRLKKAEKS